MLAKIKAALENRLPAHCLLCRAQVWGRPLCAACCDDLPWNVNACPRCAMPLALAGSGVCGQCLQSPPLFQRAFCALRYAFPCSDILNLYKHNGRLECGHLLTHALADALQQFYGEAHGNPWPQCIIPTPLHTKRRCARGFDQGVEMARVLARRLSLPRHQGLMRQRDTASQQGLNRQQRQRNLRGAFALRQTLPFTSVALVDDVLTTGSTAAEISQLLFSSGVQEVHVWAIARTT